jgi:hypothetical protein
VVRRATISKRATAYYERVGAAAAMTANPTAPAKALWTCILELLLCFDGQSKDDLPIVGSGRLGIKRVIWLKELNECVWKDEEKNLSQRQSRRRKKVVEELCRV